MMILAVDDESLALKRLRESIEEIVPDAAIYTFQKASEALRFAESHACDIAFLDIQMQGLDGITLGRELKLRYPRINIVFSTGYGDYALDAMDMNASGYLLKPITAEKVRTALENLRYPVERAVGDMMRIQCFGNFEVFVAGKPLAFKYSKTKELLAYLVDRSGALCTNGEIMAALWEDDDHSAYLRSLRKDLVDTLKRFSCSNAVVQQWGKLAIVPQQVDCDYFRWQQGDLAAINAYHGEYMAQYSWSELTNAALAKI